MKSLRQKASGLLSPKVKKKLRASVHPAQLFAVQRAVGGRRPNLGLLSVVVPLYNVEAYVAACLDSILSQSYPHLEIIVVDDGSTDRSLEIVREYRRWDRRIRIIELAHGGNGVARNRGISAATGDYLTFADSDDVVAKDAYLTMMRCLQASGSDFVVGSSDRLRGSTREPTKLSDRMHVADRLCVTIEDFPDILDDVFLWNKVFRRTFWDEHVGSIPEGVLYEDQETTARAYVRAQSFDVLAAKVYSWRIRGDRTSITQNKRSLRDLSDRLAVASQVTDLLKIEAGPGVCDVWYRRLFGSDLIPYFEQVPYVGDDYWQTLGDSVRRLAASWATNKLVSPGIETTIDPHGRVFKDLAVLGDRNAVEDVVVSRADWGTGYTITSDGTGLMAEPDYWGRLGELLPNTVMECSPSLLEAHSGLAVVSHEDGEVILAGHIYANGLDSADPAVSYRVEYSSGGGGGRAVEATRGEDPRIDVAAHDPFAAHSASHMSWSMSAKEFLDAASKDDGLVTLVLVVAGHELTASYQLRQLAASAGLLAAASVPARPTVIGFAAQQGAATLTLDVAWPAGISACPIVLQTQRERLKPLRSKEVPGGTWRYEFSLRREKWGRQVGAPLSDAYTVRYVQQRQPQERTLPALAVDPVLGRSLPTTSELDAATVTVWRTANGNAAVSLGPVLDSLERSKVGQRTVRKTFDSVEGVEIAGHYLFESFGGKFCTDSPRALSDELFQHKPDAQIYWSVLDGSVSVPSYATAVVVGSRRWCGVVQSAKVLVNNNNFPHYFRKNPKQFYLQTWHGTPLKKIGLDAPKEHLSASYRRLMAREAADWDLLLAQDAFSAGIFPAAFGYTGEIMVSGYPRNDALTGPAADERREAVRELLGLGADQHVVLYAPTWRDDAKAANGHRKWIGYLDLQAAMETLGDKYIFLIRGHHNVLGEGPTSLRRNAMDVSAYPDINDLMLASDSLLTDYSSVMFDYAVTGKPMQFLAPDVADYSETRGLYMDYESTVPGPVFTSTNDWMAYIGTGAAVEAASLAADSAAEEFCGNLKETKRLESSTIAVLSRLDELMAESADDGA